MKYLQPCLWAFRTLWRINIRLWHRLQLYAKTLKLFWSLLGFADHGRPLEQVRGAMKGAELTAVYDLDTDQQPIKKLDDSVYLVHLRHFVPNRRVRRPARKLFVQDLKGKLSADGLERGSVALAFYHALILSEWMSVYTSRQIRFFGRCLQILDDALDLVKDRVNGEKNALLGERRHNHLAEGERFVKGAFFKELANRSWLYRHYFPRKWAEVHHGLRIHRKDSATMITGRDGSPLDARRAGEVMAEVRDHMLATRPEKYGPWFGGIDMFTRIAQAANKAALLPGFGYFADAEERTVGINAAYLSAHGADDVADGDAAVPPGFSSAVEYVQHYERVLAGSEEPREAIGRLMLYGLAELNKVGADLQGEMLDIARILCFDAERRAEAVRTGTLVACSRQELAACTDLRDIRGTIGGCLKVTREHRVTVEDLRPLGEATQIRYTIRDLRHDILRLMLNIPLEDMEAFGIDMPDHTSEPAVRAWSDSEAVRRWRVAQAERAQFFLRQHQAHKAELRMHAYTRAVLFWLYQRPAQAFLGEVRRAA